MKFLLDQGLPRSTAALLRKKGLDAIHVGELGMAAATDDSIIQYARDNDCSIVTLDADFHSLLALAKASSPSIIRLRIQRLKAEASATLIADVVHRVHDALHSGNLITVTPTTIRIRKLPIQRTQ